jgi:hypothetical protein
VWPWINSVRLSVTVGVNSVRLCVTVDNWGLLINSWDSVWLLTTLCDSVDNSVRPLRDLQDCWLTLWDSVRLWKTCKTVTGDSVRLWETLWDCYLTPVRLLTTLWDSKLLINSVRLWIPLQDCWELLRTPVTVDNSVRLWETLQDCWLTLRDSVLCVINLTTLRDSVWLLTTLWDSVWLLTTGFLETLQDFARLVDLTLWDSWDFTRLLINSETLCDCWLTLWDSERLYKTID